MDRDDVLRIADAEIGYLEKATREWLDERTKNAGSANYTKYARDMDALSGWYNGPKQGYDWCAVFVEWCFVRAYGAPLARKLLPHSIYSAGCTQAAALYRAAGRWYSIPQPGDQIFFTNSRGLMGHTGIVVAYDGNTVTTIEGNTSSASGVVANGGCVRKKTYQISYNRIAGYGRPDWSAIPAPEPEPKPAPKQEEKEVDTVQERRYQTLLEIEKEVPWAKDTVDNLIRKNLLQGDGTGLDLSRDMLRLLVINDRAGCYN